jgi:hypothetical protein
MVAVAPKSSLITAFETRRTGAPSLLTPLTFGGELKSIVAVTDVAAADSDGDTFMIMPVFSSWRLDAILMKCDAITNGTAYDLGLYSVTAAFVTAAIDVDCYATDQTMASAITTLPVDLKNEALDIALNAQAVWADGSLTSDPKAWQYLAYTADTVGTAAGQIQTTAYYVDATT